MSEGDACKNRVAFPSAEMAGQIRNEGPGNKDSAAVSAQPTLQLEWHFLQCFGQPNAAEAAPNGTICPIEYVLETFLSFNFSVGSL